MRDMLTCGVDIGARTIDIVLFDGAQVVEALVRDTGAFPKKNAADAFEEVLRSAGVQASGIDRILATGYGRNYFDGAHKVASEILCHAAGVAYLFPAVRTVIDIGGQDSKMIEVSDGAVKNFVMNDRCAAGTGRFIEIVAKTLNIALEDTGKAAAGSGDSCEISSMCAVFAESEIIGLLHKGVPRETILRGVFRSVARRTLGMTGKVGLKDDVVFTGGVALNAGVLEALKHEAGRNGIKVPPNPQITGALGAAIIAAKDLKGRQL